MLKGIIAISGKPGLYKLLKRGNNALIVEALATGKRMPSYAHDKVISLADVTMYSDHGDVPLSEVLASLYTVAEEKPVDVKAFASDADIRDYFANVLPDYERERVYTADIRKLFGWYNQLVAAGVTDFKNEEKTAGAAECADGSSSGDSVAN